MTSFKRLESKCGKLGINWPTAELFVCLFVRFVGGFVSGVGYVMDVMKEVPEEIGLIGAIGFGAMGIPWPPLWISVEIQFQKN